MPECFLKGFLERMGNFGDRILGNIGQRPFYYFAGFGVIGPISGHYFGFALIPAYQMREGGERQGRVRMNVLLIGSGGREHALAWALSASPLLTKLYCAPGNPGIAQVAELAAIDITNHGAVIAFCRKYAINFVVVGPEAPLVAGLIDDLNAEGIKAFGPSKFAA